MRHLAPVQVGAIKHPAHAHAHITHRNCKRTCTNQHGAHDICRIARGVCGWENSTCHLRVPKNRPYQKSLPLKSPRTDKEGSGRLACLPRIGNGSGST